MAHKQVEAEPKQYQIPARLVLGGGLFFYILGAFLVVYLAYLSVGRIYYDFHGDDNATAEACGTYEPDRTINNSYSTIDLVGREVKNDAELEQVVADIGTCPYDISRVYRVIPVLGYATGLLSMGLGTMLLVKYKKASPKDVK